MSAKVSWTVCVFVRSSINVNTVTVKAGHVEFRINLQTLGTVERFLIMRAIFLILLVPASVAQLDVPSDWRPGGRGFNPRRGRQHSFVEIDHEIFSTVILSFPLVQEWQLSVTGERMCTILVNRLED